MKEHLSVNKLQKYHYNAIILLFGMSNTIMSLYLHPSAHNLQLLYDMSKYNKLWSELYFSHYMILTNKVNMLIFK